jgi:glycosyltransferase involved in cell wall biosynthesis
VDDLVVLTPRLSPEDQATLQAGSRAFVYPALSEGTGQGVIEALATGVPVIASKSGPLPEIVGGAGIIVEPREAERLAAAIRAVWWNDALHEQLLRVAQNRAREPRRTWTDVAQETRAVYASAVRPDESR